MTSHNEKSTGCEIADNLLSAYLDDELDEQETKLVQDHVGDCDICPQVLDDMESTINHMAALPKEAIPEHDLWDGIVAEFDGSDIVSLDEVRQKKAGWFGMTKGQLIAAGLGILMLPGVFAGGMMLGMSSDGARDYEDNGIVRVLDRPSSTVPRAALEPLRVLPVLPPIGRIVEQSDRARAQADRARERADRLRDRADRNGDARSAVEAGLVRALSDPNEDVSRQAAMSLGELDNLSDEGTQALVVALMSHRNGETRRWAAYALGEIGEETAIAPLMQALRSDSYTETRRWAAWALGEIGEPMAVDGLIDGLRDSNAEVRRWSAWGLGEIAEPHAAEALTDALGDSNPEVRRWAAWALSEIADEL
jgi:hypothetical protein